MVFTKFAAVLALVAAAVAATEGARVHHAVHRTLRKEGSVNVFVTFRTGTDAPLKAVKESTFATRGQKISALVGSLEENAQSSQGEVQALLSQESSANAFTKTESFWITNQVYIEGASAELIVKLAALPSVAEIKEEEIFSLNPIEAESSSDGSTAVAEWGVDRIGATEVWASGNLGKGVVVAAIDSGVRGTHALLKGNFRSTYGWFDPESKRATPYDNNGHGTHTMGTIAGSGGVGVAPEATWIACRGCRDRNCPQSDLLSCGQFILCPTDTSGNNKDCTKAPNVVNNSWGGGQGSTSFKAVVDSWQAAGIIPVFSQGNSGPNCGTANSPADLPNVIGVGATDIKESLARFSSKGPAVNNNLLKPDVSAPGVAVRSTWNTDDNAVNTISGTSMAGPHVVGAIALLVNAKPTLTYAEAKSLLTTTTSQQLVATNLTCGGTPDSKFPNNQYGFGRISVSAALKALKTL